MLCFQKTKIRSNCLIAAFDMKNHSEFLFETIQKNEGEFESLRRFCVRRAEGSSDVVLRAERELPAKIHSVLTAKRAFFSNLRFLNAIPR